jgi:hypothetical protein
MQLIKLEHGHWNFFCPATGKAVYGEEGGTNAETFRGGWHQEVPSGPLNLSSELQEAWDAYINQVDADEADLDVTAFLEGIDLPGWVAFEITTCGMACGPVWETTWTVLDLSDRS